MVQELWDNQQSFRLISASYFGFNKKRNIYLNWKEQAGKHAINLLAGISQNAPVKCTLTIDVFLNIYCEAKPHSPLLKMNNCTKRIEGVYTRAKKLAYKAKVQD